MNKFLTSQSKSKLLIAGLFAFALSFAAQAQSDPFVHTVTVMPPPTISIVETEVCIYDSVTVLLSGRAPFELTYTTNTLGFFPTDFGGDLGYPITTDSTDHSGVTYYHARIEAAQAGTFTFALSSFTDSLGCDGLTAPPQTHTVEVRPLPDIAVLVHSTYCNGERYWGYDLGDYPNVYTWTNLGDYVGLPMNGWGDIPSFTIINTTLNLDTARYAITAMRVYDYVSCYAYDTLLISANPAARVDTVFDVTICNNERLEVVFSGDADHFRWNKISGNSIPNLTNNGLDSIIVASVTNNTNGVLSAVYEVIPEYDYPIGGMCEGVKATFTITVYPDIVMTSSHDTILINSGETFSYTATTNVNDVSHTWDISASTSGVTANGATVSGTLTNTTADIVYYTFYDTITAGNCFVIDSIVVGVVPNLQISVANQYVCADESTTNTYTHSGTGFDVVITTTATPTDTVYTLTGVTLSTVTGSLNGTRFNYGTTNVQVVVTIAGGTQITGNFTVTVNALPAMTLNNETYCAGERVNEHVFGTGLATYSWTSAPANIGAAETGTGVLPTFVATNGTTDPIIDTFYVTATIVNPYVICSVTDTFTITVNPLPTVNPVNDTLICSNEPLMIEFDGNITGTTYNWTRISGYAITTASSGSNSIIETPINNSGFPVSAVYQVTPVSAEGCEGTPITFTITVNPALSITPLADMNYCTGSTAPAVIFNGNVSTVTYAWEWISGDNITGLPLSGNGNMPAFLALNTTVAPLTATYTVAMTYTNGETCTAVVDTFNITVYPVPIVTDPADDVSICDGDPLNIIFDGAADTYNWRKLSGNIITGLAANGTGNINIPALYNTGNTPLSALYEVTPTYNFTTGFCQGIPYTFMITVNPTPVLLTHTDGDTICSGGMFTYTATSNVIGATFEWSRAPITDINNGTAGSGYSATIAETLTNTSTAAVTVIYQYTIDINGCTSDPTSSEVSVVVLPATEAAFASRYNVCANETEVVLAYTSAATNLNYRLLFDVEAQDAGFMSVVMPAVMPADGIHVALPAGVAAGNYHATIIIDSRGCQAEYAVTIHVIPLPKIVSQPQSVAMLCPGQSLLELSVEATGENLSYQWYLNGAAISGATDETYSVLYDSTMAGDYYVMVMAECDTLYSNEVTVSTNNLIVKEKWTDFLYVDNSGNQFTGYQWYKDGNPVVIDGQSQYYVERPFLQGTYRVRVYLVDGTWIESCDFTIDNSRMLFDNLYPNPAQGGAEITVELYAELTAMSNSTFELYDVLGRCLTVQPFTGNSFKITAPTASGSYHLRIINNEAGVITKRFIVK